LSDWAHHQIGEEADDQQTAHDVQDERIGVLFRHLVQDVVVENAVDYERSDDVGG
jgi:hypothetical protein